VYEKEQGYELFNYGMKKSSRGTKLYQNSRPNTYNKHRFDTMSDLFYLLAEREKSPIRQFYRDL